MTVEDPIEYDLEGISQTQIVSRIEMSFARALRAILRQDPDVVMIGEIRDRETADIAVRASLTGHLVLSTLHTNSAAGAVTRLLDLGIEAFLLSSTLAFSAAQRLVRRLCPRCRTMAPPAAEMRLSMEGAPGARRELPDRLPVAVGCAECRGTGFAGRLPLFEALPVGPQERTRIRDAASEEALAQCARRRGCHSLRDDGWDKVAQGLTTADEVLRAVEEHST
jgi:general secretion pathway protein E